MRLRSVRLQNYRRFRDQTLEFPDGVIAVTGPNGAGKSTLLEAVAWCLYGNDAARTAKDLLRHSGAAVADDVSVVVEFEVGETAVCVTRRLRGKSLHHEAEVVVDGSLQVAPGANSADLATQTVAKLLGLDRRGYLTTIMASQGDLSALAQANASERRRLVLSLLGVPVVDAAIGEARTRKREAGAKLATVRRMAEQEVALTTRLSEATKEAQKASEAAADARASASKARGERESAAASWKHWSELRSQVVETRQRLDHWQRVLREREQASSRLANQVRLLTEKRDRLKQLVAESPTTEAYEAAKLKLSADQDARQRRKALQRQRLHALEDEKRWKEAADQGRNGFRPDEAREALDALEESTNLTQVTMEKLATERASTSHSLEAVHARLTDARQRLQTLKRLGSKTPCPTCERPLGSHADVLHETHSASLTELGQTVQTLESKANHVELEHARAKDELKRMAQERERWGKQLSAFEQAEARRAAAHSEWQRATQRVAALDQELGEAAGAELGEESRRALESVRDLYSSVREERVRLDVELASESEVRTQAQMAQEQLVRARQEIEAASRWLTQATYDEEGFTAAKRAHEAASTALAGSERVQAVAEERENAARRRIVEVERDLKALGQPSQELDALEQRVRVGEVLAADRGEAGVLPEFRAHLVGRIRPALARLAGELVEAMTQGRYRDVSIDESYQIMLHDAGQAWPLERFSGGERDVVYLALRLAVSQLLATARRAHRLGVVALDEVLASQDEQRRESVLASLKRLDAHFRQVLLVTHLDEVRERVDHVVRIEPQGDGSSRAVASWAAQ